MPFVQWLFVAGIIVIGLVGGYFQLQVLAYMKEGKRATVWIGGWLFNPGCLEAAGLKYRTRLIWCLVIGFALVMCVRFTQ